MSAAANVTPSVYVANYNGNTNLGGIFDFNAPFLGSMGGGIFAFNSTFFGSMAGKPLNKPIVGIAG